MSFLNEHHNLLRLLCCDSFDYQMNRVHYFGVVLLATFIVTIVFIIFIIGSVPLLLSLLLLLLILSSYPDSGPPREDPEL